MNKNPDNIGKREKFMKLPNENIWRYSTKRKSTISNGDGTGEKSNNNFQ